MSVKLEAGGGGSHLFHFEGLLDASGSGLRVPVTGRAFCINKNWFGVWRDLNSS